MTIGTVHETQRRAARIVGATYLLALVFANFAEFYVPTRLIVHADPAATARNILAHERLFRLGIASELIVCAADVVLLTGLYVILRPVNRSLALLATFWRVVETSVLAVTTLHGLDVLRVLGGGDYLEAFRPDQLQAVARLSLGAHDSGFGVGLVFFGLGSAVFGYLWLESGYIPRALAAWGLFSSLLIAAWAFAVILFPDAASASAAVIAGNVPIALFEVAMGLWLLLKGLRPSRVSEVR